MQWYLSLLRFSRHQLVCLCSTADARKFETSFVCYSYFFFSEEMFLILSATLKTLKT